MWSWCQPNSGDSQRDACASGLVPEELRCGLLSSRRRSPSARGAFFSQALLRIFLPLQTPPVAQGPFQALFLGLSSWQDSNLLSRTTRLCSTGLWSVTKAFACSESRIYGNQCLSVVLEMTAPQRHACCFYAPLPFSGVLIYVARAQYCIWSFVLTFCIHESSVCMYRVSEDSL